MAWRKPTTSSAARGYGRAHRKLRAHWEPLVAKGTVNCWRCSRRITPGTAWELGHDDYDRSIYRGPEHKACNRKAGARKARANQVANAKTATINGCPICGNKVKAGRTYCSQRCGYIAHLAAPPKPKTVRIPKPPPPPPTPAPPRECAACGTEYTQRRKYCSDACMWEYNARIARERYRKQQGLPSTWDQPRTIHRNKLMITNDSKQW